MANGRVAPVQLDMGFDQALVQDPSASGAGWNMILGGTQYLTPTMAILPGGNIRLTSWAPFGPAVGIDRVTYSNPAGVVRGLSGIPADPFVDFPVV